jgi:hypothetical protein
MKPTVAEKQRQNKGEKEGKKGRAIKKSNRKGGKGNKKTDTQTKRRINRKKLT